MSTQAAIRSLNQRRGASGDWRRRLLLHHAPLAVVSAVVLFLFMSLSPFDPQAYPQEGMGPGVFPRVALVGEGVQQRFFMSPQDLYQDAKRSLESEGRQRRFFMTRVTDATGYVATGLLALTLLIGPANLLLRRRTPVSSYFRRDVGTWTAIFSVVHVIFGWQLHGGGRISAMLNYFFAPDGSPMLDNFGLANWSGLAALVIVVMLLALSTDGALRELKARTWKNLQRLNYTLFALVILHVFFYGALLRMTSPFTLLGVLTVIAVVVGQAVGGWLWRRRYSRTTAR
ncbi:MAG: ferric reductase-like transmembrane domain-containing protein [Ardenticatenaceae bacterium]|nr:ferric reductase-like transmembrane domain-containing protein [Ardenticatenaceae bacterium]